MNLEPSTGRSSVSNAGLSSRTEPAADVATPNTEIADCILAVRQALEDVKAQNIVEIDVRGITNMADTIIIASGTSTRHVKALADNVAEEAKKAGFRPIGVEGERDAEWILVDLGYVIVHTMLPTARSFYDLESLWKPTADKARSI
ncbi:MAG: ribosome silencing factor [Pseudomonadota bacterium]|jgi:ribosome-associated protein